MFPVRRSAPVQAPVPASQDPAPAATLQDRVEPLRREAEAALPPQHMRLGCNGGIVHALRAELAAAEPENVAWVAHAVAALPPEERREVADWLEQDADLFTQPRQVGVDMVRALSRVPRRLRAGVWGLSLRGRSALPGARRGGRVPDSAWLARIVALPVALLTRWVEWVPLLEGAPPILRHAVAWLASLEPARLGPSLVLALANPTDFEHLAQVLWALTPSHGTPEVAAAVQARLHDGSERGRQQPAGVLATVAAELRQGLLQRAPQARVPDRVRDDFGVCMAFQFTGSRSAMDPPYFEHRERLRLRAQILQELRSEIETDRAVQEKFAPALAALQDEEQREVLAWLAAEWQILAESRKIISAEVEVLCRVPRALRRGVWELWRRDARQAHAVDLERLARIAALPVPALSQWLKWQQLGTRSAEACTQAVLWATEPRVNEPLPTLSATEPWEQHRQRAARAAALATRAVLDLDTPEAIQAAHLRSAYALAFLLGGRANLAPHALHALLDPAGPINSANPTRITRREAAQGAVHAWGGIGPFPETVAAWLRNEYLPVNSNTLPALFAFCDSLHPAEALATPLRIAALEALEPPAGAHLDDRPFTCAVCDEATMVHTHLGGCTCTPALCDGCAAEAVARVGDRPAPLTREYLERLGVPPPLRVQRLVALHRGRLRQVPYWALPPDGLGGHEDLPPPMGARKIPDIRPGQDPRVLRLLLSGLAAWPNYNGDGVHRECYERAQPVQKGDACMHMTCRGAPPHAWDFERGPFDGQARFATAGLQAQAYIPLTRGPLGLAGFYDGLPKGAANSTTRALVAKRRKAWLKRLGGVVAPQPEKILRSVGGNFLQLG